MASRLSLPKGPEIKLPKRSAKPDGGAPKAKRGAAKPRRGGVGKRGGAGVTGLELEPSAVHAASVSVNGLVTVKEAALAPLDEGVVRDGEVQDVEALSATLKKLFADHRSLDKRVRVGIANAKIVVRVMTLPPIADPKQLDQAVRFQAQDELPMPLDQAVLDFQALDVVDTPEGPRQRVALVAARRDMVERVLSAVRGAGLKPEGIDLAAFGMVRALHRTVAAPDETVGYLAVGGLTNLAVARGAVCEFTRVLGSGVDAIATELAERRQLTLEHARGWLEHTGLAVPVEDVDGYADNPLIIDDARTLLLDGIRRLAQDVRSSMDFAATSEPVARCVLTGPAATIAGFTDRLASELMIPVELGVVQTPPGVEAGRLTVAAGLALEEAA